MTEVFELRGPAGIRTALADFYREWLPQHAPACRAAWGLSDAELPVPASVPEDRRRDAYLDRSPAALDRWPVLAVNSGRRSHTESDRADDGSPIYVATYPIRIYSWVRAGGQEATALMRDNLASAVAVTTLAHAALGTAGALALDHGSLVLDFSDVSAVKGDRFVAGSYVGFNVRATETLTDRLAVPAQQPRDTVSGVNVLGVPLPFTFDVET